MTEEHCLKRWCPACSPIVTATRFHKWKHALSLLQWPLFITLTIPNSEDPEQLRFLRSRWSSFRRRKIIRSRVKGGVASFEITDKGNGWHPHLHALIDCKWLALHVPEPLPTDSADLVKLKCQYAQRELSHAWADTIGEQTAVVWATRAAGDKAIMEVLKYAVKTDDLLNAVQPIAPMLRVIAKTRMLSGFGSLHPMPSPDQEEGTLLCCEKCGAEKSYLPDEIIHYITGHQPDHAKGRTVSPAGG